MCIYCVYATILFLFENLQIEFRDRRWKEIQCLFISVFFQEELEGFLVIYFYVIIVFSVYNIDVFGFFSQVLLQAMVSSVFYVWNFFDNFLFLSWSQEGGFREVGVGFEGLGWKIVLYFSLGSRFLFRRCIVGVGNRYEYLFIG